MSAGFDVPNRILREGILTSERVDQLQAPAEVFYRRLMSVVDDFGRYYAKPELLRAALFPLRLDTVRNADIASWIGCAREAGLLVVYAVEGKEYLELCDFRQHARAKESKFPQLPPDASQMQRTCSADVVPLQASAPVFVCEDVVEKRASARGSRLLLTELPKDWRAFCESERKGLDPEDAFQRFRDYWIAQPGQKGVKLDWQATWRNWVRNERGDGKQVRKTSW